MLHQGLAEQLGISFGAANLLVSVAVLVLSWALRAHIGLGTFLNALLIGSFLIVLAHIDLITDLSEQGLAVRIVLLVVALPFFGVGSAFYICASMGAGPRDSLMLVISQRVGIRIGAARTALELAAFARRLRARGHGRDRHARLRARDRPRGRGVLLAARPHVPGERRSSICAA